LGESFIIVQGILQEALSRMRIIMLKETQVSASVVPGFFDLDDTGAQITRQLTTGESRHITEIENSIWTEHIY
jgi:hypothetical protein